MRQALAGNYEYYHAGGTYAMSYDTTRKINLCMSGSFSRGGENSNSGANGTAYGNRASGGTWTAQGDQFQGTIILMYGNGQQEQLPYQVSTDPKDRSGYGPALRIGSTLYQKTGPGGC